MTKFSHNWIVTAWCLIAGFLVIGVWQGCGEKSGEMDAEIITRVGDRTITRTEFDRGYAFAPSSVKQGSPENVKQRFLDGMIEEKLLAIAAEEHSLDGNPELKRKLQYYEDREIIRELYRRNVRKEITLSREEIDDAFRKQGIELHVRHLFTRDRETADSLRQLLEAGESFQSLAREVFSDPKLAESGGDLGMITWGDLDAGLEEAAFRVPVGEISAPVESRFGYHILRVESRVRSGFQTVNEYVNRRESIETVLRRRKEQEKAHRFIQETMEPLNTELKGRPFWVLVDAIWSRMGPEPDTLKTLLRHDELNFLHRELTDYRHAPLVTSTARNWTVTEVLDLYRYHPMGLSLKSHSHLAASLKNVIGILTRDSYLAELGRKRGLAKARQVQETRSQWRDRLLADQFRRLVYDSLTVSEKSATAYYNRHKKELKSQPGLQAVSRRYHQLPAAQKLKVKARAKQSLLRSVLEKELTALRESVPVRINYGALEQIRLPDANAPRKIDLVGTWLQ